MKEFKYTIDGKEYKVAIGEIDENNIASVNVNGEDFKVQMEKEAEPEKKKVVLGKPAQTEETEATPSANVNTNNAVKAPLPGTITAINVEVGQEVKAGDAVVVLEAMKMANNIEAEKIRFLEILQNIDYFKEKIFSNSKIEIIDTSILELFIHLFIEEVEKIVKKGLIYKYVDKNENLNVFKGKLDINSHIKYNFSHKERFFMKFDEFSVNSLENIIIKLTIQKLKKISINPKNKESLNKIGYYFENISILENSIENLKYLTFDRMNDYYKNAIQWSKIFLDNQSSSIFSTNNGEIPSILFPMETIFENYIANKLVNIIQEKSYCELLFKIQDSSCSLFSSISLNHLF